MPVKADLTEALLHTIQVVLALMVSTVDLHHIILVDLVRMAGHKVKVVLPRITQAVLVHKVVHQHPDD